MKTIEIEFRARFDESEYDRLSEYLQKNAEDLGEDDKNTYFFVLPDRLAKVAHNVSKKTAKIGLKLSKIGQGSSFEEIELPIDPADVDQAVRLFQNLNLPGDVKVIESFQKRHNYLLDGVELSLKYSENWGHHMELEIVVDDMAKKASAEKRIFELAKRLSVSIMTEEELIELTGKIQAGYKK